MLLAVVFAGLARAFPDAAGPQDYARMAFGATTSFMVMWAYWIANLVGNAALATAATSYLGNLWPTLANPVAAPTTTLGLLWMFTAVNIHSLHAANRTQIVTVVLKLLPLAAMVGLGLWLLATGSTQLHNAKLGATPWRAQDVNAAAALTLWAMLGLESAAIVARRVHEPQRTIARASVLGTGLAAIISIIACTTVMALIPAAKLSHSAAPFADAIGMFWGSNAAHAVALFAAISCVGAMNGWLLVNSQLSSQMARSRWLPMFFARESARGTPTTSLWINSALTTLLVLANYGKSVAAVFNFMILLSTTATLVMYLICSFALLRLLQDGRLQAARGGGAWLAVVGALGALYAVWTLYGAGGSALLWGAVLLVVGLPVYYGLHASRKAALAQ